jgi:hypothetical protein
MGQAWGRLHVESVFLIKKGLPTGLAAHIADTFGKPLCQAPLKLSTWEAQSKPPEHMVICKSCLKKQGQTRR